MAIPVGTLSPEVTLPIIQGFLVSGGAVGPASGQLASALSLGLFQYASAVVVTTVDVGTLGAGSGFGQGIFLSPDALSASLTAFAVSHGIAGPSAPGILASFALGLCTSLLGAVVVTAHPSVGVGAGKVQLSPTGGGPLAFSSALASFGLAGVSAPGLGDALGLAMDSVISSASGVVSITGASSIYPSSGSGFGKLT